MASTQALKGRIRSVSSTKQITKAMELVAASKMRRAQEATKASAPYTIAATSLLANLSEHVTVQTHPLFEKRQVKSRLFIVIASDKGLAGAFNSNIIRLYANELKADAEKGISNKTITIGRRAGQFAARLKNVDVIGTYEDTPDKPETQELRSILGTARQLFESGEVDAVDVIYTDYVSTLNQVAKTKRLLPAGAHHTPTSGTVKDVLYEPSPEEVLDGVVYRLITAQLYQALLDSRASEHSMRMMAMRNATDNASDLIDDLTLAMNKARQGAITQELAEISGGVEAMND